VGSRPEASEVLKGIHPLLHAELLHVLASMGHGDELAIVDGNFPAAALARRLIQLPVSSAAQALDAILTLLPWTRWWRVRRSPCR